MLAWTLAAVVHGAFADVGDGTSLIQWSFKSSVSDGERRIGAGVKGESSWQDAAKAEAKLWADLKASTDAEEGEEEESEQDEEIASAKQERLMAPLTKQWQVRKAAKKRAEREAAGSREEATRSEVEREEVLRQGREQKRKDTWKQKYKQYLEAKAKRQGQPDRQVKVAEPGGVQ
mmetsp:Transcript_52605/g.122450  ORF Transcript_52605/g.122450 Transcript_52605/m.122450 type:complete len:175 (+) Transcript_52605:81-605(+)